MRQNSKVTPEKEITEPQIYGVNAFVAEDCAGNPAGVCLLPEKKDEKYYRKVAIKMDLPETAFVYRENDIYKLRWFTPGGNEVDLCGHATLATSHILWSKGYMDTNKPIYYDTKSGILSAKREGDYITLDFPLEELTELKDRKNDFAALLGLNPLYTGKTKFDYLVVVDSEEAIKNLNPDFEKLKRLGERGIIVTAKAVGKEYDFVSRFFAPAIGINEDPVTGSAHCALGVYWSPILKKKELTGYQASREGGIVKVTVLQDRVLLGGKAREVALSAFDL
jgi:PhzF family phenazine biosynthesis protein